MAVEREDEQIVEAGDMYCAKRCGAGCKRAAYDRAVKEADLLAASLGDGWVGKVWDNLGWHWRADKGCCGVYPSKNGSGMTGTYTVTGYTAYFNSGGGQHLGEGATPQDAVGLAISKAHATIDALNADIRSLAA